MARLGKLHASRRIISSPKVHPIGGGGRLGRVAVAVRHSEGERASLTLLAHKRTNFGTFDDVRESRASSAIIRGSSANSDAHSQLAPLL